MNRKGVITLDWVGIAAIALISLAVVMLMVYPFFAKSGKESGEKSKCELSILLGSLARFGGVERIPPHCRANIVNIDQKMIDPQNVLARQELSRLAELKNNPDYKEVTEHFNDPSNKEQLTELVANKIIAKELSSCWDKVVHGKLGMFDEWYNLFDITLFGFRKGDYYTQKDADKLVDNWNAGFFEVWGPPKFCIVCSDITFSKDIKLNKQVTSFTPWLKTTPHPYYKDQSIYEFLVRDQNYEFEPDYNYEISPGKQYAVVFERVNTHKAGQWLDKIKNVFVTDENPVPDSINRLVLTEYDNVVKPFSESERGESCFKIID